MGPTPAQKITRQATMAARDRLPELKNVVDAQFPGWSPEAKAALIAGYMTASAEYEVAQYLRQLSEGIEVLRAELQSQSNKEE